MNFLHIYPGSEYAVFPHGKNKGDSFQPGGQRIKVIRKFKTQDSYRQRQTAYVSAIRLTRDGEPHPNDNGNLKEYRCYDVWGDWDEYEDELQHYEIQEEERERKNQEIREQRAREREERERLTLEKRNRVEQALKDMGIEAYTSPYNENINMTFDQFIKWLDSQEKYWCKICAKEFIKLNLNQGA
jgi:hypothetical protein